MFYSTLSKIHTSNLVTSVNSVVPALEAATWPQAPSSSSCEPSEPGVERRRTQRRNTENFGFWEVKYTWVMHVYFKKINTMYHRMYMYTLIHHHRTLYENDVYTYEVYPYKYRLDKQYHHQRWHSVKVQNSSTRPNIGRSQSYWISTGLFHTDFFLLKDQSPSHCKTPSNNVQKVNNITFEFKILPDFKACRIARAQNHWA